MVSGQIKQRKLKRTKKLFPHERKDQLNSTQAQEGGGTDIRFTSLFVSVFLSLSLLAFAPPGFSGSEEEAEQRRTSERTGRVREAAQPHVR